MSGLWSRRLRTVGLLMLVAVLTCGCGGSLSSRHVKEVGFAAHPRIAILPFDNFTDQDLVSGKITAYFEAAMAGRDAMAVMARPRRRARHRRTGAVSR